MNAPAPTPVANGKRGKIIGTILGVFALAGLTYGAYWMFWGRYSESTDDAYVNANMVQVTPQTGGTVMSIMADDTDFVKAGAPLVQLDPADARDDSRSRDETNHRSGCEIGSNQRVARQNTNKADWNRRHDDEWNREAAEPAQYEDIDQHHHYRESSA